jgi:MFS family permease
MEIRNSNVEIRNKSEIRNSNLGSEFIVTRRRPYLLSDGFAICPTKNSGNRRFFEADPLTPATLSLTLFGLRKKTLDSLHECSLVAMNPRMSLSRRLRQELFVASFTSILEKAKNTMSNGTAPNAKRLLWAGFFSIFASGLGFAVRTNVLVHWARAYGFTQTELGEIGGGGLWGFGVIIIVGSLIADRFGYGRLMVFACIMHVLSALLQLCTDPIYDAFGRDGVYWSLYVAMFMFAIGNGTCEVVVNPMVAALFPNEKTHYLNILHAGWPGGLVAGGILSYVMNNIYPVHWIVQMSMFLIPVAIYALMLVGQHIPRSEASQAGVSYGTMLAEFAAPVLLLLLLIHAMVGYVELGTDSWMPEIVSRFLAEGGILLFTYTSALMFTLRFFAGPIEHRLTPLGLLLGSAIIAAIGLTLFGSANSVLLFVVAATVYGIGKTFFWPTMLAVVSERFPRGGALTIGTVGGIGMLSAGLLGSPGIGFQQDWYSTEQLKEVARPTYDRYKKTVKHDGAYVDEPSHFLGFKVVALDGKKVGLLDLEQRLAKAQEQSLSNPDKEKTRDTAAFLQAQVSLMLKDKELSEWWPQTKEYADQDAKPINDARIHGGRMAFRLTALVPATMALLYLLLLLGFKLRGGYKPVVIEDEKVMDEAMEKALQAPGSAEA